MNRLIPTRRSVLAGLAACAAVHPHGSQAQALQKVTVTKDPSCGCCSAWADHLRTAGFPVEIKETTEVNRLKVRLGVPQALASCHTAEVGGYVVEGHVPADTIKLLLAEKPQARGLAVPGMPVGSPGMEIEGAAPDTYEVVLFGPQGHTTFARYQGLRAL